MIPYPHINPEIVRVGPLAVRWYGLMYVLGFASSYVLVARQIKQKNLDLERDFLDSLYTFIVLGLIIGARLGYVLFYNLSFYVQNPLDIFDLRAGGMSFHGGLIGSVLAGIWCCKRSAKDPWQVADLVMATAPIGLGFGRLGNFINGELYGRVTNVPWAMVFPADRDVPRHPSQLYEFFLEGVVLFTILWIAKDRVRTTGVLTSLFITLYGVFRFILEFFREPDPQLGFILGPFTMGQVLSATMALIGVLQLCLRLKKTHAS
jgi:phosphatidylglycerol:prolipoprotein diacylglycerol transferase